MQKTLSNRPDVDRVTLKIRRHKRHDLGAKRPRRQPTLQAVTSFLNMAVGR